MPKREYTDKEREAKRLYYIKNKERMLTYAKQWREDHPDRVRDLNRQWREANPDRKAESRRAYYERNRDTVLSRASERWQQLTDSCVRSTFATVAGLQAKDIPAELVPAIRLSILIRRELRSQKGKK